MSSSIILPGLGSVTRVSTFVEIFENLILGCLKNAKSLKSQAPQGFSGCLDIENDEMNKKFFLSASPRVN